MRTAPNFLVATSDEQGGATLEDQQAVFVRTLVSSGRMPIGRSRLRHDSPPAELQLSDARADT
jgi:hypothetical protein